MDSTGDFDKYPEDVGEFYKDRNVFITGGTGFVGKAIIEKLLRSCPDVGNIYVLVRPKRGKSVQERIETLKKDPIFTRLNKENENAIHKMIAVSGDVSLPKLGLNDQDLDELIDKVSVILHSAATVRFAEPLPIAVQINLLGTRRVIDLAKQLKDLAALVHISSTYCNYPAKTADEKVYDVQVNPDAFAKLVTTIDPKILSKIEVPLRGDFPNTYTITKQLSEYIVEQEFQNGLPAIIIRPAAVSSAIRDPAPGWLDSYSAVNGIIAQISRGAIRSWFCDGNCILYLAPVDTCANSVIVAAAHIYWKRSDDIFVANSTTTGISYHDLRLKVLKYTREYPTINCLFYPNYNITTSVVKHRYVQFLYHLIPAYFIDFIHGLKGKRQIAVRIVKIANEEGDLIEQFTTRQFNFKVENLVKMENCLSDSDKMIFPLDITKLNFSDYMKTYILGIRQFLFKDELNTLPAAKKQLNKLWLLYILFRSAKTIGILYGLYKIKNILFTQDRMISALSTGYRMIDYAKEHFITK